MRKVLIIAALLVLAYAWPDRRVDAPPARPAEATRPAGAASPGLAAAYRDHASNVHVSGAGTVLRVLPDDQDGDRHQRFILRLESGQTLLVAHNIDLAQRVPGMSSGDVVEFSGEYVWNAQGGVLHWTHLDPQRVHGAGWLRHNGRTYQ